MKASLLALSAILIAAPDLARADDPAPLADPDSEVSKRNYERGLELYAKGAYADAIAEFEAANEALPSSALLYDIARARDRMGDWKNALTAYRKFWGAATPDKRTPDVLARIDLLSARLAAERAPAEHTRQTRWRSAGYTIGAAAVASFVVGGAMYGWAASDRAGREQYCAALPRDCVHAELADLYARQNASYALFAVGGVLAAADVVVWTVELSRERREHRRVSVGANCGGFVLGGSF